jgi:MEDS: MEthanogen/methylotroph, DcmR Sensory domain
MLEQDRWLLIRRRISDGEYAFYRVHATHPVPLAQLVRVAGSRWKVEVGHRWHRSKHAAFSWLCSLFRGGVVVQAVSSGRGCRNPAGGPGVRVAAASAHHDPGFLATEMAVTASSSDRFRHLALLYHGRGEYVAALCGFIKASRARGDAVFAAVPKRNAQLVHQELGDGADVTLADMTELGRTRRGSSRRSWPLPVSIVATTFDASVSRSGPAARPQSCGRQSGMRRSSTWPSATALLLLSALTTAPGFPDRSLPTRHARTRLSSGTTRPQSAPGT